MNTDTSTTYTPLQRVLTALSGKEPDRVPLFLLPNLHGARELNLSIKDYFSRPENVAEGQVRMQERYNYDCYSGFFYGAVEAEAFGMDTIFRDDGPPNSGTPVIQDPAQIKDLEPPSVEQSPRLQEVLKTIQILKKKAGDEIPVVGVAISPFSLPVMQMGFGPYIELMFGNPEAFGQLMKVNETFCVQWANAQLQAGATAICYFDPVSSPTITPREFYIKTGFEVAKRTLARIAGPTATHLASGRCLSVVDDLAQTGTAIVGASCLEDLSQLKKACKGKLTVLGNLNGIEMRRWTRQKAEAIVKDAIAKAAPGGGFILSDNHGELPWQVPEEVISFISDALHKWGRYPLEWLHRHD